MNRDRAVRRAVLVGLAGLSSVVHAETAATPPATTSPGDVGEIIVTALRTSERLIEVPASISAFSTETLELTGARTGGDLVALTSGVSMTVGAVQAGDVQVQIRGLNGTRAAETSVAVIVDGVQRSSRAAVIQNQGILEQVEVLKGPQGALYGRNATAGAIVITTRKPGDSFEGELTASAGNNATRFASGVVGGPLSDTVRFQLGGDWSETDGFYRNSFLGSADNRRVFPNNSTDASSVDSREDWNVYARLLWSPDERTEFDAKIRYGEFRGNALNFNAVLQLPGLAAVTGNPLFNIDTNDHQFIHASNVASRNDLETLEVSVLGTRDLEFAKLKGYVAYSDFRNSLGADGASGSFNFFSGSSLCGSTTAALIGFPVEAPFAIGALAPPYSPTTCDGFGVERHDNRDLSVELRLISPSGSPLDWQAGIFFMNNERRDCVGTEADLGQGFIAGCFTADPRAPTEALRDDATNIDVYAAFGSIGYRFAGGLNLQAALRYDREVRQSTNRVPTDARTHYVGNPATGYPNGTDTVPANYFLNPGLDPAYSPNGLAPRLKKNFDQVQPKFTASYTLTPDIRVFGSWGIGFKSGGFNGGGTEAMVNGLFNQVFNSGILVSDVFDKETNSAFELGVKGQAFDHRLSYSLAGYYSDVKGYQTFEFFVGTFGSLLVVENIDKVRIHGIEGDVNWRATDWLSLFAAANYTSSEIRKNNTRPYTAGNDAPLTPEYTFNAGAQLNVPLAPGWSLFARADARVTGPMWFSAVQDNDVPSYFGTANYKNSQRDEFTIVNARIGVERGAVSVSAYGNNLFDTEYLRDSAVTPEFGGDFISPGDRRAYGLEVRFRF